MFARDADNGMAQAFQFTLHDEWDYSINENVLIDIPWPDGTGKVHVQPQRIRRHHRPAER